MLQTRAIMSSSLKASERSLVKIGRKRLSPADARVNIAAGRNFAGPRESRRLLALFADPLTKGTGRTRGARSPLAITPMSRPSEAARTAGCAVAKRKPQTGGIFFFHEDTRTTRSARLPYYMYRVHAHTWRRRRDSPKEGGGGRRRPRHRNTRGRKIKMED